MSTTSARRNNPKPPAPPAPPKRAMPPVRDGIELTDEDLEIVVGGLSPEASMAYANWLSVEMKRAGS